MAALMMAAAQNQPRSSQPDQPLPGQSQHDAMASMPGMAMSAASESSNRPSGAVGFPYGFPTPGAYRIFVQMKHGQTVETAAFDACARSPKAD